MPDRPTEVERRKQAKREKRLFEAPYIIPSAEVANPLVGIGGERVQRYLDRVIRESS